jgi:hypothetical protein
MSFAAAIDAIFADPTLAAAAIYRPLGRPSFPVRVLRRRPDQAVSFGGATIVTPAVLFEVRTAEVPEPAAGDEIVIDGIVHVVQGAPRRDLARLVWTLEAAPE